jgi:3-dehydroquinate synthase
VKRLELTLPGRSEVFIGDGALEALTPTSGRLAVVVDENVERLHGERLRGLWQGHRCEWMTVPSGERHKTLRTAEALYERLGALRLERGERVVAVGGGVTGDLAGFVAATWRRGVEFIQVPTTLLAMVDASVGGKVAVDLPQGKNLVGAFHPAAQVLVDPSFLTTLPVRERWAGLAEVVKTALLAGGPLFDAVDDGLEAIAAGRSDATPVIESCVAYKAEVVARDPVERGERAVLNLGHTLGHALETAGGFERLLHGEAVAWGLRAALSLSGLDDARARRLVERLPCVSLAGLTRDEVIGHVRGDKKSEGGEPRFVLLDAVGKPRFGVRLDERRWTAEVDRLLALGAE